MGGCEPLNLRPVDLVENGAFRQHLRQDDRLLSVGRVEYVKRHAVTAVLAQILRYRGIGVRPVALEIGDLVAGEGLLHRLRRQRDPLVDEAGDAPGRRHVDEDGLARPAQRREAAFGPARFTLGGGSRRGRRGDVEEERDRADGGGRGAAPAECASASLVLPCHAEQPGGEADQQGSAQRRQHAVSASLLIGDPDKPHRRAIHREGERLTEDRHPAPGPRQKARRRRKEGQHRVRRGKAEPHDQEDQNRHGGRRGRRRRDRHAHEWGGTGRRHQHREQAGEKAANMAAGARQTVACARNARVDFEQAGKVQAQPEQQPAHGDDEDRRLELESPSRRHARRAQDQQQAAERRKGDEDAERIADRVGPDAAMGVTGQSGDADRLHRQDREDAGHQVEDQAAEEGEGERGQDAGTGGRRRLGREGRRLRSGGRAAGLRRYGQEALAPGRVLQDRHAGKALFGVVGRPQFQRERDLAVGDCRLLRREIVDLAPGGGQERSVANRGEPAVAARKRQHAIGRHGGGIGRRRGNARVGGGEQGRLRGGFFPAGRQVEPQFALLRHADFFADQPIDLGLDRERRKP